MRANRLEKRAEKFDLSKIHADPSLSHVIFPPEVPGSFQFLLSVKKIITII